MNEVFTVSANTDIKEEKLSLKKDDMFIAHTKCIHAGGAASESNYTKFGIIRDPVSKKFDKTIVDVCFYFHFTFDKDETDATTRKAVVIRKE